MGRRLRPDAPAALHPSGLSEPPQERQRLDQRALLVRSKRPRDRLGEPAFAAAAILAQPVVAAIGQLDQDLAPVVRIGMTGDEAVTFELVEGLRHRLRPDALGGGERARLRPVAVEAADHARLGDRYKWDALSNTTLGVLLATIDGSIVLIAMPDIFRGIGLDPLRPGNSFDLLWMILGFLVVSSVLVVSLGRLGDLYGRVRMYNVGFIVYTSRRSC